MTKLRTRYRIVFLYRELHNGKCVDTPLFYKLSGAVDGDAFDEYKEFAKEVYDTLPHKCIITDKSGVCIVLYAQREPFIFKEGSFISQQFIYKAKVHYVFTVRKDGVKIAYKVNTKTGRKTPTNYKKARRNDNSQKSRIRVGGRKFKVSEKARKDAYKTRKKNAQSRHKATKKTVLKQFEMFQGCYSKDLAYKGR